MNSTTAGRATLPLLAPLSFLIGCAPAADAPPLFVQRDSAGIAIIESFAPAWGDSAHWRIDPEPLLDLASSGAGDEHNFYGVRTVTRLPDGGIAVANRGSAEVRKFSSAGSFVASVGGYGEGPGEFSNLQQAELVGDSLLVRDIYRTALFGPDLQLVRTVQLHPGVRTLRYLEGGVIVVATVTEYPETHGLVRPPVALLLYDLEGVRLDSVGSLPGSEEFVTEALMAFPLFGRTSVLDSHDGRIFTGSSDRMQVEELSASGDTLRILRIPNYPLALVPGAVEAERNARLNPPLPPGVSSLPPPIVEAVEAMPSPETRPAYSELFVDPSGAVWLRPFRGRGEQGAAEDWVVFGRDGVWLGSVGVPADFVVREIGVDEVLGIRTDELGVQSPQVLRLRR